MKNIIADMEAAGQREMLTGNLLPRQLSDCTESSLTKLGFELGEIVDDLFRKGSLPPGWTLKADGSYHTAILDPDGNHRGYLSYKAAFLR